MEKERLKVGEERCDIRSVLRIFFGMREIRMASGNDYLRVTGLNRLAVTFKQNVPHGIGYFEWMKKVVHANQSILKMVCCHSNNCKRCSKTWSQVCVMALIFPC